MDICVFHNIPRYIFLKQYSIYWVFLVAQMVKNPPAMQDTWVWSLGWEYLLEREWLPTPVFLPGQRSLADYGVANSWTRLSDYALQHSVQSLSGGWLFVTPRTAARQASVSITNSWSLHKLMSIESVMPSSHLILCCPLSSCLQSFPASGSFPMSQVFATGGQSIGFSFNISPSNE